MIRRSVPLDHDWIRDLAAEVYGQLGDYGRIIPAWLIHPGVLAYVDQEDAGAPSAVRRGFFLLGFYEPPEIAPGQFVADLLAIAVAPRYQRRGIGRALLEYAVETAASVTGNGVVSQIRLTVADTNLAGQRLFTSCGFRVLDENHGSYDGGQRAIRMGRSLP